MNRAVMAWPELSTSCAEVIQAFGRFGDPSCRVFGPAEPGPTPTMDAELSVGMTGKDRCSGAKRCGRTERLMTRRAATKTTMVLAMAGRVRRMRTPAARPRAKANAA